MPFMSHAALPLLAVMNLLFAAAVIEYELHYLHAENSLLENFQALLLALGTLWFALSRAPDPVRQSFERALAVLCFSFFLREVDMERLTIPVVLQILGSGQGRVIVLLVLWALVLRSLWRLRHAGVREHLLRQARPGTLVATLMLLLTSLVMDKNLLPAELPRLWEELAETNAYLILVTGHVARYVRA